ncbi:MAG: hypothetical protein CM1200mP10_00140 [Candidatus Neomarinimicrobiota bacterium]|nr:MAG: hypothetical protein CM1200mP10_00140 [Candidatus Neomarinimicrobiota bacterium]
MPLFTWNSESFFKFVAIILTYNLTGTLEFSKTGIFFPPVVQSVNPELLYIIFVLFFFGFPKSAIMPFHSWLPAAMVAPPQSAHYCMPSRWLKLGSLPFFG